MRLPSIILALALLGFQRMAADEVFTPPRQYPADRYEAGWNKNPFTLKSAPPLLETASFAKDFVIGAYYGDATDPTVVLVNTKTQERIRLKKNQVAANGMTLGIVKLGGGRKEIYAEVKLGPETAQIHYDSGYLRQLAASESTRAVAGQSQQSRQSTTAPANPQVPGQQSPTPAPVASATDQAPSNPVIPMPGTGSTTAQPAASTTPVAQLSPSTRRILSPAAKAAGH